MKLGLGTAQFGFDYGVSNVYGKASLDDAREILAIGAELGLRYLDTAPLYGRSESLIGEALPQPNAFFIVTKTPRFHGRDITAREEEAVEAAFLESLRNLRQERLYGLLVHNAEDLFAPGGDRIYWRMRKLKAEGLLLRIGVSVYNGEQIDRVLSQFDIDLIQVPLSVFDQRLIVSGRLKELKRHGIEVHARSVFLQGILLMEPGALPPYFDSVRNHIQRYRRFLEDLGMTPLTAALHFATSVPEVDSIICGLARATELRQICDALRMPRKIADFSEFAVGDPAILDPSVWVLRK